MTDEAQPKPLLTATDITARAEMPIRHPWNPNSEVYLKHLAHDAGLRRVALTMARLPPGKESFVCHSHERDEEFLFILSGRGRAEIDGTIHEVGPGELAEVAERLEHAVKAIEQLVPLIAERQRMVLADALVEISDNHDAQLLAALDRITDATNVAARALGRTSVD